MPKRYEFHSHIPPEQFPDWLAGQADQWNRQAEDSEGCHSVIKVGWKDSRLRVSRIVTEKQSGRVRIAGTGYFWSGWSASWYCSWSNPFWAQLRADSQGGSVLTGQFRLCRAAYVAYPAFLAAVVLVCRLAGAPFWYIIVAEILALYGFVSAWMKLDIGDHPEHILLFLQSCLEEREDHVQAL